MGNTNREQRKIEQRKALREVKTEKMKRGDKRAVKYEQGLPELVEKPISASRGRRLDSDNLTHDKLPNFINEKTLYSNTYYSEGVVATTVNLDYDELSSDCGIRLDFQNSESTVEHYFGFELSQNSSGRTAIKIHYLTVEEDGSPFFNGTKEVRPRNFSARNLLNIVKEHQ